MSFPEFSMINSYAVLTALEREIGRPRVRAMAEAYLAATLPPLRVPTPGSLNGFAIGPAPGGGPVTPPGYDYGPPAGPAPHTDARGPRWARSPLPSPVLGPAASGLETPPATPPRLAAAATGAPGAPARPLRSRGGLGLMRFPQEDDDRILEELQRTDPENPLLCGRHRYMNAPLGPSRNSSGQWGTYVSPGSGCRECQEDDREDAATHVDSLPPTAATIPPELLGTQCPAAPAAAWDWMRERELHAVMWDATWDAERERTPESVARARAALEAYTQLTRDHMPVNLDRTMVASRLAGIVVVPHDYAEAAEEYGSAAGGAAGGGS